MEVKLGPHGILVEKPVTEERKLESGIIIPQTQKQSKPKSKVVATGRGTKDNPMEVRVGDVVTYSATLGREITAPDGTEYLLMDVSNCLYID